MDRGNGQRRGRGWLTSGWLGIAGAALVGLGVFSAAGLTLADPPKAAEGSELVRIGILAFRPLPETQARWQPLAGYLQETIPQHVFQVTALHYGELEAAIARRQVDFVLTQPSHYVLMSYRNGLSAPLATLVERDGGHALEQFGGVIFTRKDRADITSLADLRGKTVAASGKFALGGYQMQAGELRKAGLRLPEHAILLEVGQPQEQVIQAVLAGQADAGFVRTGVIETLAQAGRLDPSRLSILNRQVHYGFPYAASTRLYPEWAFAAMPRVEKELVRLVAGALLSLPHDSPLTEAMAIHGFTTPADYRPVDALLRELRLPPFDAVPDFTVEDAWSRWHWELLFALLAVGIIVALSLMLVLTNRRLRLQRQALREQEQMLRTVYDVLPVGISITDPGGRIVDCNAASEALLGISRAEHLRRGSDSDAWRIIRPDGSAMPAEEHASARALTGQVVVRDVEMGIVRPDGVVWISVSAMPAPNEKYGVVIVYEDITERRRVARALREEHARTKHYLDTVQTIIVALDAAGHITMINRRGCELLGWSEAELLGRQWFTTCLPQPAGSDIVYPVFKQLMEGSPEGAEYFENPVLCRNGTLRLIAWHNAFLYEDGHLVGVLSSGEDVTDSRAAEREAGRAAEERRLILAALGEGVYGVDMLGRCTFVNPAAMAMLGLVEGQAVGRDQHELFHHHRADGSPYPRGDCPIFSTLADGQTRHVEEWFFRADGSGFPADLTVSVLERNGEPLGAVVVFRDISARKEEEATLRRQREEIERLSARNAQLLASAGEGIFGVDLAFRCSFVNPAALAMLGYAEADLIGGNTHQFFHHHHPDGGVYPEADCPVHKTLQDGQTRSVEDTFVRRNGEFFPVQLTVTPILEGGERVGAEVLFQDIGERKATEARTRLLVSALEATGNSIIITDQDAHIQWVNAAFERLTGFGREEAMGRRPADLVKSGRHDRSYYEALWRTIRAGEVWRGELTNRRKDGRLYCQELVIAPVHDDNGRISHFVGAGQDISDRKNLEAEMRALAATDSLTGLPNRRSFLARLEEEAARANRFEGPPAALLMLDLDHFKQINDRHGHAAGDSVLRAFADCLRDSLRKTDLAGRLGGEEFGLLLVGSGRENAQRFAERLREKVAALRVETADRVLHVTVSIGVTLLDAADASADQALVRADEALYRAKAAGRDRVELG